MKRISQAIILKENHVLLVQQHTQSKKIVWNFPGGGIEAGETPEEAVVREVKEETGFEAKINRLLFENEKKSSYICEIVGGEKYENSPDEDIITIDWVNIHDTNRIDERVREILDKL